MIFKWVGCLFESKMLICRITKDILFTQSTRAPLYCTKSVHIRQTGVDKFHILPSSAVVDEIKASIQNASSS